MFIALVKEASGAVRRAGMKLNGDRLVGVPARRTALSDISDLAINI